MHRSALMVLGVVLAACAAACGPSAPTQVVLGANLHMTGVFAGFGAGSQFGMQTAVDDINAQGGVEVDGQMVEVTLAIRDNASVEAEVVTATEGLIFDDGAHILLSGQATPTGVTQFVRIAERERIPNLASTPTELWTGRSETHDYSWQSFGAYAARPEPGDPRAATGSGYTFADAYLGALEVVAAGTNRKVGMTGTDDQSGGEFMNSFAPVLQDAGFEIFGRTSNAGLWPRVGPTPADFAQRVQLFIDNNVEIVWGNANAPQTNLFLRKAKEMGFTPKVVAFGRGPVFYEDVKNWDAGVMLGLGTEIFWTETYSPDECPGIGTRTAQSLADDYKAATGKPMVNQAIGTAYHQVQVALDAIHRAGSLERDAINQAMRETDLRTVACRVLFDSQHANRLPISYGQWVTRNADIRLVTSYSEHPFSPEVIQPSDAEVYPMPGLL